MQKEPHKCVTLALFCLQPAELTTGNRDQATAFQTVYELLVNTTIISFLVSFGVKLYNSLGLTILHCVH